MELGMYRAKAIETGKWVFGYYAQAQGECNHCIIPREAVTNWSCDEGVDMLSGFIEVDPMTVGMLSGEKDRHHQDIYGSIPVEVGSDQPPRWTKGGDIISSDRPTACWKAGNVLYHGSAFRVHAFILCQLPNCEIIGNQTDDIELEKVA